MSTVLIAVVLLAALACPAHMWWRHRRGADPCCLPRDPSSTLDELRARQLALSRQIAAQAADETHTDAQPALRA